MDSMNLIRIDDLARIGNELADDQLPAVAGGKWPPITLNFGGKITNGDKGTGYEGSVTLTIVLNK